MMFYNNPIRKIDKTKLIKYLGQYSYTASPAYKSYGYLTAEDFLQIAFWKSTRPLKHYKNNKESMIIDVTRSSFNKGVGEEFRIEALTILNGVNYPVASALLHLGCSETYPIIDFRTIWALWEVDIKSSDYTPELWCYYVDICRKLATDNNMSVRDIDKALWQFSKKEQI